MEAKKLKLITDGADAAYDITFSEEGVLSYDAER